MKQKFVLRDEQRKLRATRAIMAVTTDPIHEVLIRPHKKDRSAAQRSLEWLWCTVIGDYLGWSKEAVHVYYKRTILVHIYERDDVEYAAMILALKKVYEAGLREDADKLKNAIVNLTSTTKASVKQMREYLMGIERDAQAQGIRLPHPPDRYPEAMGIKNVSKT